MQYVVAVSGGVDSVALLDMLARGTLPGVNSQIPIANLIVAHFDHGIRPDSADDAEFVKSLAEKYNLLFETKREELGANASEELARDRRYVFLREVAAKHDAKIMTAHHADDVVETIAINLTRGTGWRGLAVLDSPDIDRPLLATTKAELIQYARNHDLKWREDVTNQDEKYLRNKLRQRVRELDGDTKESLRLYRNRQVALKRLSDDETSRLIGQSPYSRHLFTMAGDIAAHELLRAVFIREAGTSPTRPQLARALHAVKVMSAGKVYEVAGGITLRFTKTRFIVETSYKVLS